MKAMILLVDNELEFVTSLQAELEAGGYQVAVAGSRKQAQEMIRTTKPNLVILGTITPRGDAFQLQQWMKKTPTTKELPLIVIDAPPEKQLTSGWRRSEGIRLEADDYFRKPLRPTVLLPVVDKLLDRTTRKIKVLIADDHAVVREGICALLSLQKDMMLVGEATDGKDALHKTLQLSPDVVLMDIVMPGMNGIEATKHISRECKQVKVLVLSQYDDEENVLACRQAGASGFIPKKSASSQLLQTIRAVS